MAQSFCVHAVFPNFYDGTHVSYSLKSILEGMSTVLPAQALVLCKGRSTHGEVRALLPTTFYGQTNRLVRDPSKWIIWRYGHLIRPGDVAYLWLSNPPDLTRNLQEKGVCVVREMINCTLERKRAELRRAYELLGQPDASGITDAEIEGERAELLAADGVFCPNEFVLESVLAYGVTPARCMRASYGWGAERITSHSSPRPKSAGLDLLYVGRAEVRKGFPWLLEAWARAGVEGRLLIAGYIEPKIRIDYAAILGRPDVVELGYVRDIGEVYGSADAFCFPTWEEGGPMVTIEAMAAGLPCIVTPMGSAGIVSDNTGGAIIVNPGDTDAIARAIRVLSADDSLRASMGLRARDVAAGYNWERVGKRRAEAIMRLREQWCQGDRRAGSRRWFAR